MNSLTLALELKTCRSNPTHHYSSEHSVLFVKPVLRIWEDWIAYLYALFLKSKNTFTNFFLKKKSGTVETAPTVPGAAPLRNITTHEQDTLTYFTPMLYVNIP